MNPEIGFNKIGLLESEGPGHKKARNSTLPPGTPRRVWDRQRRAHAFKRELPSFHPIPD